MINDLYRHQTIESKTFYLMYDFRFTKIIFMEDVEICGLVLKIVAREKNYLQRLRQLEKLGQYLIRKFVLTQNCFFFDNKFFRIFLNSIFKKNPLRIFLLYKY